MRVLFIKSARVGNWVQKTAGGKNVLFTYLFLKKWHREDTGCPVVILAREQ